MVRQLDFDERHAVFGPIRCGNIADELHAAIGVVERAVDKQTPFGLVAGHTTTVRRSTCSAWRRGRGPRPYTRDRLEWWVVCGPHRLIPQ